MLPNSDSENVEYNITIEIAQALTSLRDLNSKISNVPEVIQNVQSAIQTMADKTGISFAAMEAKFKSVALEAEKFKRSVEIGGTPIGGVENINFDNPLLDALKGAGQPFGNLGNAAGYKALNDSRREAITISNQERRSEAEIANEINKQKATEEQLLAIRQKNLDLSNQELKAVEQEGAAVQKQLSLYGQVSRTTSETMNYLRSFAGTQQGEGILTKFIGNYQSVRGVTEQVGVLKNSILELSKATGSSFGQAGTIIKEQFGQIPGIAAQTNQAVSELDKGFKKVESSSKTAANGINLVKTALHILVASAIFAVINAFQQLFSMAIKGLRELETATYNLINAERTLSEQGIAITPKGLDETIKKLQELDPLLSRIQATELVSRTATLVAPNVGFNAEQINQFSQAVAVLAVRNKGLGKSFEEVESQISNAFLSGRVSVGINQLGVKITDQIVKDEALRLGLVKTADEFDNLTGKMEANIKASAMLSILVQNTNKEQQHLPEYLKTADAQFGIFQARLQDLLTMVGKDMGPALITIFDFLAKAISGWIIILEKAKPVIQGTVMLFSGLAGAFKASFETEGGIKNFRENIKKGFVDGVNDAKNSLKEFADYADTATADVAESTAENLEKAADNFDKFKQKFDDIVTDFNRKREDLDIQQGRKVEDLDTEYSQKNADAVQDYQDKVADINRQSQQKIADIKTKQRQEELQAEREQTNKLLELRQKYLMNLQDALRNRDALQVLKLQQEYEIEKSNLERTSKIEKQKRVNDTKEQIKQAQDDRKRKLEDARIDFERKQRDLEISKQREFATIVQWRAREEDDLKRATARRLVDLVNEYTLSAGATQQYLNTLLGMIQSFSAQAGIAFQSPFTGTLPGGTIPSVSKSPSGPPANAPTSLSGVTGSSGAVGSRGASGRISGLAEGGSFIATRPRTINVAETSPELITATPLGKVGKDINKLFIDGGMSSNNNSRISLKLMLSRGLEAQLVESAMNNVAFVIEQINGEK